VEVRYYPSSDMLNLRLADQESVESEAERLGIDKRTFNRVVRNMRDHGLDVGLRPDLAIYVSADQAAISQWRELHPPGRPRARAHA
jgi:hypothetical protein